MGGSDLLLLHDKKVPSKTQRIPLINTITKRNNKVLFKNKNKNQALKIPQTYEAQSYEPKK